MVTDMYQQYLWLIGKLKDQFQLHVDADHRDIHTFYHEKIPIFKLLFGKFKQKDHEEIVCSFHIDVKAPEAIYWWIKLQEYHPDIRITEVHIEDDAGETYLGEDAQKLKDLKIQQEVLKLWMDSEDGKEEMKQFVASKVVGRIRERTFFDSQTEVDKAIIEFDLLKKPTDDGDVH